MTWLNGPLVGFDTETTSVDVETDRIVTACIGRVDQPGPWRSTTELVACGYPISPGATAVHGITDERAAHGIHPIKALAWIDLELQAAWERGAPVIAFNAVFDLTIADREMRRHLGRPLLINGPVIDPFVLDQAMVVKRRGKRNLITTCGHYNVKLTEADAHTAGGDTHAAVRLAWAIGRKYPEIGNSSLADLQKAQARWYVAQRENKFEWLRSQGKTPDDLNTTWPMAPYVEREAEVMS